MCSKLLELGREERGRTREERGAIVYPDFGRNRSKCSQGRRNYGGKRGNCPPNFWQELQQMCSRPLELARKGGQLLPQILKGIAANVLKAVGTRGKRNAIAPPNFGRSCSKCAQGRWN